MNEVFKEGKYNERIINVNGGNTTSILLITTTANAIMKVSWQQEIAKKKDKLCQPISREKEKQHKQKIRKQKCW